MKKYRILIPSWSPLSVEMQAETGNKYPAFLQLGGCALFVHIARTYEPIKHEAEIVVVLPIDAPPLQDDQLDGFDVKTLYLNKSSSIGETVLAAISDLQENTCVVVHMADTIISAYDIRSDFDALFVQQRSDLYRWTSVKKTASGRVHIITDRNQGTTDVEQLVCVGVFIFSSAQALLRNLKTSIESPATGIDPFFSAIETYSVNKNIDFKKPAQWHDCGHIDSYYESRLKFNNLRHFNSLTYDSERGLVTKRSENAEAFRHQVRWFKQVPDDLNSFLPRIYESNDGEKPYITMELLSTPTLSDLFITSRVAVGAWNEVGRKLTKIQSILRKHEFKSPVGSQLANEIYVEKTRHRIMQYIKQRPATRSMWIERSGKQFTLDLVLATLKRYADGNQLLELQTLAPIHGDLCFSNIMYDPRNRHIKLIDPRGEFGVPGIYGDPRYDMAKLMHSYIGGYDFIVSDQFKTRILVNGQLDGKLQRGDYHHKVRQILDSELFRDDDDRYQCEAIQALLFLSMLPLHSDKPNRQVIMLQIGLEQYAANLERLEGTS